MKKLLYVLICVLTIQSSFTALSSADTSIFSDVNNKHWAYYAIQKAYQDRAMNGMKSYHAGFRRKFEPRGILTRAQFITIITRAFYSEQLNEANGGAGTSWYSGSVKIAGKHNLWQANMSDAELSKPISRYEMAQLIYNLLQDYHHNMPKEQEVVKQEEQIADIDSVRQKNLDKVVATLFHLDILKGVDAEGTFAGNRTLTRAEGAVIYTKLDPLLQDEKLARINKKRQDEILHLVNLERQKAGVKPLRLNASLSKAAFMRALEIQEIYEHKRPTGKDWSSVLSEVGYNYLTAGENLALGQKTSEEVVRAWMNSPGHRKNILNPKFEEIGVGSYEKGWTQVFGTPQNQ